mmetsp:Transcript_45019/g.90227  ORF Transcript_45019/g.90227 Transcript_45019/m.90227 type:complete len:273 (+) Transcript_45019:2-820(+)
MFLHHHYQSTMVERVYQLFSSVIHLFLLYCRESREGLWAAQGFGVQPEVPHRLPVFEKILWIVQGLMCMMAVFRGMMGFEEYGHFVLMLVKMLRNDLRKFMAIYVVFLVGFSHASFIAADRVGTGLVNYVDSMRNSFEALLQQMELQVSWDAAEVTFIIIGLCNFFVVSLALVNLLVAMMSTTYEQISQDSMLQWGLVRATIIISIDHDLDKAERLSDACRYFEWEGNNASSGMRFMTFTSGDDRQEYLRQKRKRKSTPKEKKVNDLPCSQE